MQREHSADVAEAPQAIGERERLLALRLKQRRDAAAGPRRIGAADAALSSAQEGLWFLEQLEGLGGVYNSTRALHLRGPLDVAVLERSLRALIVRHESLRTAFVPGDDATAPVRQVVKPSATANTLVLHSEALDDAAARSTTSPQQALQDRLAAAARTPFDLAKPPLLRAHLLRLSEHEHLLLIVVHHIVFDGGSMGVLMRELSALCAAGGDASGLPPLPIQFADYAAWQRERLSAEPMRRQLQYWREQLDGLEPLELPTDRPRPPRASYRGAVHMVELPVALAARLKELARRESVTLFMLQLAAFQVLLMRYARQPDIAVGVPVAGRGRLELEGMVGCLVNTVVLRSSLAGNPRFTELLGRVRRTAIDAYANEELPFDRLVAELSPQRDLGRNPLYQVSFALERADPNPIALGAATAVPLPWYGDTAKFDLSLTVTEQGNALRAAFEYATDLFDAPSIERMAAHWRTLLEGIADDPECTLAELPLLRADDRQRILYEWNDTARPYPPAPGLHRLIEAQVERSPHAPALRIGEESLCYRELDERANRLARRLRGLGVTAEVTVGVCMPRSLELPVAVLAILKAGGAYVPLDPEDPDERLHYILRDCGAVVLLTSQSLRPRLAGVAARVVCLDSPDDLALLPEDDLPQDGTARQLAYVIYTSGSTGRPKGVLLEHGGVCNHAQWLAELLSIGPSDRFLQKTSIGFDASIVELLAPLTCGATVVLAQVHGERDTDYVVQAIRRYGITVLQMVPSALRALLEQPQLPACSSLRYLICGGEALDRELAREVHRLLPQVGFGNFYGPTEASIDAAFQSVSQVLPGSGTVPIGTPIANARCHVLDAQLRPVPIGVAGELCIGGAGLARGYLNQPALQAQRFIADPFRSGERLYRSGDLARYLADGSIEYVGRMDDQVKLRGFRIELGEIEAALRACPGVRDSAVLLREDRPGLKRLVAYVVSSVSDCSGLRTLLRERLPEQMLPSAIVSLPELPLLASGKLDRRALPAPQGVRSAAGEYEAPRGVDEELIASLWQDLLGLERVGRNDHFFELGGHSLLVVTLLERLRQHGFSGSVGMVFAHPTLSGLAAVVAGADLTTLPSSVPPNHIPHGCTAIEPSMLSLVDLSQQDVDQVVSQIPGGAANIQDILPLMPLQEGMLFEHLLDAQGDAYLGRWLLAFDSRVRLDRFLAALQASIDRHDALRTAVIGAGLSQAVQVVCRRVALPICELTSTGDDALERLREATDPRHFRLDLSRAPLMAAHVVHDAKSERWLLALSTHHIVIDHVSEQVLLDDIELVLNGQAHTLGQPLPYREFVAHACSVPVQEHEAYFRAMLGEVDEPTLPFGLRDVRGAAERNHRARCHLDGALARRIRGGAARHGVSAAVLFHVAWALVVGRCSGRNEVVFGTVLAGRSLGLAGASRVMGMFINTLPMRLPVAGVGVLAAVKEAHRRASELMKHEHASLVLAQRCSAVAAPVPLFSALLNYRHSRAEVLGTVGSGAFEGVSMLAREVPAHYPFGVAVDDLGDGFALTAHCDKRIDPQRIAGYLQTAIESLVQALDSDPLAAIENIEVLPPAERHRLLRDLEGAKIEEANGQLIQALFERQARRSAQAVAVHSRDESVSYADLGRRALRLAHTLRARGAGRGRRVGLCLERGPDMVVAQLAILQCGAAYVPLDPAYPAERLAFMAQDAQLTLFVTDAALANAANWPRAQCLLVDLDAEDIAAQPDGPLRADADLDARPEDAAYVIYTSGSTGRPKGVMVPHGAVVNLLHSMAREPGLRADDRLLAVTTLSFDIAVLELLLPLSVGATVILAGREHALDGYALGRLLASSQATVMQATPTTWQMLVETGWQAPAGFKALIGGEPLPPALAAQLLARGAELWNLYGPTETTVWSTCWKVTDPESGIRIGRPIDNTRVLVLDEHLRPCPIGVAGELCIGGDGVALGYLHRAELTAERFIADPAGGGRLYRTGDRGRWGDDGLLEHLGRLDGQIKLRGHRIEPGEIEAALASHPQVARAVVLVREDHPGDVRLVAYIVPCNAAGASLPGGAELREHLRRSLPEYMLPQHIVELAALPLLPNGKIDRKALSPPDPASAGRQDGPVAPRTEAERAIGEIWQRLLGVGDVSITDNFFDLGGHSLLAMRALQEMNQRLGLRITPQRVIYECLAQLAATRQADQEDAPRAGLFGRLLGALRPRAKQAW